MSVVFPSDQSVWASDTPGVLARRISTRVLRAPQPCFPASTYHAMAGCVRVAVTMLCETAECDGSEKATRGAVHVWPSVEVRILMMFEPSCTTRYERTSSPRALSNV